MNSRQILTAIVGILILFAVATGFGVLIQNYFKSPWDLILELVVAAVIAFGGIRLLERVLNR